MSSHTTRLSRYVWVTNHLPSTLPKGPGRALLVGKMRLLAPLISMMLLTGCASSEFIVIGDPGPSPAEAGETLPYPDGSAEDSAPAADSAIPDGASDADETSPTLVPCSPSKSDQARICVRVTTGGGRPGSSEKGLDGVGTLTIGLSTLPWGPGVTFAASTTLPSVSSGARFRIEDLPKTVELTAPPGKYFVYAFFRDAEPFDRRTLAVGDYAGNLGKIPEVTLSAGIGVGQELTIFPLREIEVNIALTAAPIGKGTGPLRVWGLDSDGKVVADSRIGCIDLGKAKGTSVRLLTTAVGEIDLLAGLYDFALGPDDAVITASKPSAGSVVSYDAKATYPFTFVNPLEWRGAEAKVPLWNVIPFGSTTVPEDPSTVCGDSLAWDKF